MFVGPPVVPRGGRARPVTVRREPSVAATGAIGFEGEYPDWLAEQGEQFVPIECPAGTAVLLHGENVHYSAPNTSDASRHAYSVHFVDGDAKWSESNWLRRDEGFPFEPL